MYCIFAIEIQSHHFFIRKVELFVPWCLKITGNVSFNDIAKNGQFGQFLKKPCGQTVVPERSSSIRQNWWKMPKMKHSRETFWGDFHTVCDICGQIQFNDSNTLKSSLCSHYFRELVAPHLSNVENLSYSHLGALRLSFSLCFAHR